MIQDKTQAAVNGTVLFKDCNAVLEHLSCSLCGSLNHSI
jgi:hypothetical protein